MKRNSIILFVISVLAFASCDVLDHSPQEELPTGGIFTSETNVRAVLAGAYDLLQTAVPYHMRFTELAGDNAEHTGSYPSWGDVDQHNLLADNAEARDTYINFYEVINTANNLIAFTDGVEDPTFSEASKAEIIAEAKTIRAYSYHVLVNWFGGIPFVDEPVSGIDESANVPRSSKNDVYAFIIQDLEDAEEVLGASGSSGAVTISGYAAKALLARVYLYNEQYTEAAQKATEVIDSGEYEVTGVDYISNFGDAEADGQNSSESIFELSFTSEDSNDLSFYARPNGNGGRFEYGPTQDFKNLFDAGDERYDANVRTYSGTDVLGKYFRVNGSDNIIIIRLAEMYLIRAEAMQSLTSDAIDDVNVIRERAGLAPVAVADFVDFDELLDEILLQRRIELAQEGHRWHDLNRTGQAETVLGIDANATLWPIPEREMNSNSALTPEDQNPGY